MFTEQIESVVRAAKEFIEKSVTKHGQIVLATEEDFENDDELIHELPAVEYVGKYSTYDEYAIMSVQLSKEEKVEVTGYGKGEINGNIETFDISSLTVFSACWLADLVKEKIK